MKIILIILILVFFICVNVFTQTAQKHMNGGFKFMSHQSYILDPIAEELLTKSTKGNLLFYSNNKGYLKNETSSQNASLPDSIIGQNFDNISNSWVNNYKIALSYDNYGNNTLSISYQWNDSTEQWLCLEKFEQTYNASGKRILYNISLWDVTDSLWINDLKNETVWDPNMEWAKSFTFKWDTAHSLWDSSHKASSNFDKNGNTTLYLTHRRDQNTNEWIRNWKEEYTYDSLGNNIKLYEFNWDVNTSLWDSAYRIEKAYNSVGEKIKQISYQMDVYSGLVAYAYKYEYAYDERGNLIQQLITSDISKSCDQWQYRKIEFTRDDWGNTTQSHEYLLNITDSHWILQNFSITEYDASGNYTTTISYRIFGSDTVPGNKSCYYYSELPTSDNYELRQENNPCLYPNPANGYFYIRTESSECKSTLLLFDVQGKLLINQIVTNTTPISTEKLQKGMYIYRISENGRIFTGKLIVQ